MTSEERPMRKLSQGEYQWQVFSDDGRPAEYGDLWVDEDGVVRFVPVSSASEEWCTDRI